MVQVRMGEEHVVNNPHLIQRKVAYAGSGVNKDVAVYEERRGTTVFRDSARAAQHTHFHRNPLLRFEIRRAVPLRIEWQQPHGGYPIRIKVVQVFFGIHPQQIQYEQIALVPVLDAISS